MNLLPILYSRFNEIFEILEVLLSLILPYTNIAIGFISKVKELIIYFFYFILFYFIFYFIFYFLGK